MGWNEFIVLGGHFFHGRKPPPEMTIRAASQCPDRVGINSSRPLRRTRRRREQKQHGHDIPCHTGEGEEKDRLFVDVVFRFQALQQRLKKWFGGIWGGADGLSHFFGGGWKVA